MKRQQQFELISKVGAEDRTTDLSSQLDQTESVGSEDPTPCPNCGGSEIDTRTELQPFKYGTEDSQTELAALVPVRTCRHCGFEYLDHAAETARHEAVCQHLGLLTPAEIKAIRQRHRLTQRQLARITGLGVATIARWETGTLIQNPANDRHMRMLEYASGYQLACTIADELEAPSPVKRSGQTRCIRNADQVRQQGKTFYLRSPQRLGR